MNPIIVKKDQVNAHFLANMLRVGLSRFTGEKAEADAWRKVLGPARKVLIKFNRSGADELKTTEPVMEELLASLERGGFGRHSIMLLDVAPEQARRSGTADPITGYQKEPVTVLGRQERLSAALDWADCLINVPFIKDHHLAGVTCAMKNLSHGLIRSPANWHGDRCRQAIPHLFALPAIQSKLKLTICNGLRIVIQGGPAAPSEHTIEHSRLIFAADAVAMDAYAAKVINQQRGMHGLNDLSEAGRPPTYLTVARELGLGQSDMDLIDVAEYEA